MVDAGDIGWIEGQALGTTTIFRTSGLQVLFLAAIGTIYGCLIYDR
jgi:hypothetical protein